MITKCSSLQSLSSKLIVKLCEASPLYGAVTYYWITKMDTEWTVKCKRYEKKVYLVILDMEAINGVASSATAR